MKNFVGVKYFICLTYEHPFYFASRASFNFSWIFFDCVFSLKASSDWDLCNIFNWVVTHINH